MVLYVQSSATSFQVVWNSLMKSKPKLIQCLIVSDYNHFGYDVTSAMTCCHRVPCSYSLNVNRLTISKGNILFIHSSCDRIDQRQTLAMQQLCSCQESSHSPNFHTALLLLLFEQQSYLQFNLFSCSDSFKSDIHRWHLQLLCITALQLGKVRRKTWMPLSPPLHSSQT